MQRHLQRASVTGLGLSGRCLASRRKPEVLIGHLEIMLLGDGLAVADPLTDHVNRERVRQFRLPGGPEILPDLRPRHQTSTADDPLKLRPKVYSRSPIAGNDVGGPLVGLLPSSVQVRP
jgi:hypothetical protein